ncbi:protein PF3D7_1417600-like [Sitodiplosis mosellana]|uniref:protein PF3D7_1417600-like n=1 Tax=Sitodiplosis mosellana TaxID=263140 RepID=UPI002444CC68|nr:protein PF3D7_1417600-like [Sitodiplosis mosellana]
MMSTSTEFEAIADSCAPRNALFCCRSPICLNNSPQLVPVKNTPMDSQHQNDSTIYPVRVPDLSDAGLYTDLITQPRKYCDVNGKSKQNAITDMSEGSQPNKMHQINKSQSAQDIRHYGVSLRRVTPPKCTVSVKKNDNPMMNVVLRKVEKKLLEPPKPTTHEKSPPPKKLTSATTNAGVTILKSKKTRIASNNQNLIAKSKSTNDVTKKTEADLKKTLALAKPPLQQPPPPPSSTVNLLKTQRPPLEIHKIEGDKIIIIRRVPRAHRLAADCDLKLKSLPSLSAAPINQNRISTYDFPMFCENEKSIQPTTHKCVSKSKPNMTQPTCYVEHSTMITKQPDRTGTSYKNVNECLLDAKSSIPLSKSASLQAFSSGNPFSENLLSSKYAKSPKKKNNSSLWTAAEKRTNISTANVKNLQIVAPGTSLAQTIHNSGCNRYNKYDSESSSGSDLIDLTSRKNVSVGEMYNDDIDYMNNYLKSLPDYNELNKKISNEQQKCEDIYDRLLCINSSLKSNFLPKSNSCHSIATALVKPHQSLSVQSGNNAKNKIIRSSSSSVVNHNMISNRGHTGVTPIDSMNSIKTKACPNQIISSKLPQVSSQTKLDFNETFKFQNTLPKSASSTSLQRSNSKKGLNEFWSENLAKSNQQKMGWNYNKIMANKLENFKSDNNNVTPSNGYKLQKNMSLSQLGQRIQQNVSREELYNLICNNEPDRPLETDTSTKINCNSFLQLDAPPKLTSNRSTQIHKPQSVQQSYVPMGMINPLEKSVSQASMPSTYIQRMKMKSPRKNNIPTLCQPICRSTSNTYVFSRAHEGQQDSFTPTNLMKSSSSSSIFNTAPGNMTANIKLITNCSINNTNNIGTVSGQSNKSKAVLNSENKINMNNELLKIQNEIPFHETSSLNKRNTENKFAAKTFNKFNSIFTQNRKNPNSKSNIQMPIFTNLPSTISHDTNIKSSRNSMNISSNKCLETTLKSEKNNDKTLPTKLMSQTVSGPLKLNQMIGTQYVENTKSNESCYIKNNSIMDHQNNCMHPKMNFTSSIIMTSTVPELQTLRLKKNTDRELTENRNEQYSMRNVDTHNTNLASSFDSTSAINSSTNCNHIKPEICEKVFLQNPTSNAAQIPIHQRSSHERPEQIFGTKVTNQICFFIVFF